jgi:AcrR family transcriptional regulator
MDDIIAVTGGSKRTLYKYFHSKEELFFAVIVSVADRAMNGLVLKHESDLRKTLTTFGTNYLLTLVSPEGLSLFRSVVAESPLLPELGAAFMENAPGRVSKLLADYFRSLGEGAGVTKPETAAEQFLALVRGDLHFIALLGGPAPSRHKIRASVEVAVETFLDGRSVARR